MTLRTPQIAGSQSERDGVLEKDNAENLTESIADPCLS